MHSAGRIRLGAVVEMLHTATLVHDDIIDEADTRRGGHRRIRPGATPSACSPATGSTCSPSAALEERNFRVLDLLISLTQQMVEGELLQMQKLGHLINEEEYFDLIFRKTACLFKVSMQLGAALASRAALCRRRRRSAAWRVRAESGLAFQIVDDVLDLTAAEDVLGKPVASDLREGKATLAVIHALERGTGADREAIRTVLADRSFETLAHRRFWRFFTAMARSTTPWIRPAPMPKPPDFHRGAAGHESSAPCSGYRDLSPPATARPCSHYAPPAVHSDSRERSPRSNPNIRCYRMHRNGLRPLMIVAASLALSLQAQRTSTRHPKPIVSS